MFDFVAHALTAVQAELIGACAAVVVLIIAVLLWITAAKKRRNKRQNIPKGSENVLGATDFPEEVETEENTEDQTESVVDTPGTDGHLPDTAETSVAEFNPPNVEEEAKSETFRQQDEYEQTVENESGVNGNNVNENDVSVNDVSVNDVKANAENSFDKGVWEDAEFDEDVIVDYGTGDYPFTPSLESLFPDEDFDVLEEEYDDAQEKADRTEERKDARRKITFVSKMKATSVENHAIYNAVKNELLSYRGIHSRVVAGGDYFRKRGKQLAKIVLIGRTLRLALALDPADYDYNIYHQRNRGGMKKYADTPMFVKIRSRVGVYRASKLIADMMGREKKKKNKKYIALDYAREIMLAENIGQSAFGGSENTNTDRRDNER